MCIREPAVSLRGQAPEAFRAANFTRLVVKGDETLGMQLGKVLTDADYGDAKDARQRAGRQRPARLESCGRRRLRQAGGRSSRRAWCSPYASCWVECCCTR
jgi:hypothetical protein